MTVNLWSTISQLTVLAQVRARSKCRSEPNVDDSRTRGISERALSRAGALEAQRPGAGQMTGSLVCPRREGVTAPLHLVHTLAGRRARRRKLPYTAGFFRWIPTDPRSAP